MEAIIAIIMEQVTIWAPSLVAVVGILVGVLKGVSTLKEATKDIRNEKCFKDIREELEKQHSDLLREHHDNIIMKRQLQEVINQLSHVKDYHADKFGEMEGEKDEKTDE